MIIQGADRLSEIQEYYFSRKLEQIAQLNKQGRDVINLGIGSPDLSPSPATIEAAAEAMKSPANHGYASYRGSPELRAAMADWYKSTYSVSLDPQKNVLPLLGSKEGIFYISLAFLNPGDKVLVPNPGYPAYASVSKLVGANVIAYDLLEENDWTPDLESLSRSNLSGVKLMWVNYPHMPTGQRAKPGLFQKLVEFGLRHKILICHDNPYSMVLNTEAPKSFLEYDPQFTCSLELNSLSKAFNMAGWRIGMLMSSQDVVDAVIKVKSNADSGMFLPLQKAAIQAFKNCDAWHSDRNRTYESRREWTYRIFQKLGYQYSENQVGLFVWAKAPESIKNVEAHIDEILQKNSVFLTPGFIFGSNGARYARCSLCAPVERLKLAYQRLGGTL